MNVSLYFSNIWDLSIDLIATLSINIDDLGESPELLDVLITLFDFFMDEKDLLGTLGLATFELMVIFILGDKGMFKF